MHIYRGDLYCDDCATIIKKKSYNETADKMRFPTIDSWEDYSEFVEDAETYPQHVLPGEADFPEHCHCEENCVNAIEIIETGEKVGAWLENELTSEGEEYVKNAVSTAINNGEISVALEVWQHEYNYLDFPDYCDNCDNCGAEATLSEDCDLLMVCEDCLESEGCVGCNGNEGCSGDCYHYPCTD